MKGKKIGTNWISKLRGTPVNTKIKICIDCGSTKISINEKIIKCKSCGASHKRKEITHHKFQPGDLVKIIDTDKGANLIYKIEKINQDGDGTVHYVLKSKSSPITLFYNENSESHLEKVNK